MLSNTKLFLILIVASLVSIAYALGTGSVDISWNQILHLSDPQNAFAKNLVLDLRLPRASAAFVTGAMLALAGALMQVLLRNPLADPYILGVSGGAASCALTAILLGAGATIVSSASFAGAILSTALVFGLARSGGSWTSTRLLLTGVVIASGWAALISFLLSISPNTHVQSMLFWLMGDLGQAEFPAWQAMILILIVLLSYPLARSLNIMTRGDLHASSLGVSVHHVRIFIYLASSLLTASAVSIAGSIGFVGLVVPHILRLMSGSDHRILLPASVLLGGSLLVVADTLSRTLMSPLQLPVGVLTAFLGVPLFLFLLRKGR
jgi:iron complex transport system permease protein